MIKSIQINGFMMALTLAATTFSPLSQASTTKEFVSKCDINDLGGKDQIENFVDFGFCMGFIQAYHEAPDLIALGYSTGFSLGLSANGDFNSTKKPPIGFDAASVGNKVVGCIKHKTAIDLSSAFIRWTKNNPKSLNLPYGESFSKAMLYSFPPPCNY